MNGFRKIFPTFLSHYATFFAKMAKRKVVPFDEFYYQLKLMHLFQKHLLLQLIIDKKLIIYLATSVLGPRESLCLGNAENFQIWRAVLTYDQSKK
jgi:hypothetical protein